MIFLYFLFNFGYLSELVLASDSDLTLTSNSPVVIGGTVEFKASLSNEEGDFMFEWSDDSLNRNTRTQETSSPYDTWNVTYTGSPAGPYIVQVNVLKKHFFIFIPLTSQRLVFELTDELNGALNLTQNNTSLGNFVSNNDTVVHQIYLKESDERYLNSSSKSALTYWFIDCEYHGVTNDFQYVHFYNRTDVSHHVEALVVAGYEPPITTVAPTTTTTTSTTTTVTTTTTERITSTPSISTSKAGHTHKNITESSRRRRSIESATHIPQEIIYYNGNELISSNKQFSLESRFICNGSVIPVSENSIYGYFARSFTVKAPVSKLTIAGNTWITQGNILQLEISCAGSAPFLYCVNYYPGVYNISGNESCISPFNIETCNFNIGRYYGSPGKHTILIIVKNDIEKRITPITVTVYEVKKQPQLSVIVIPVGFSIVAIILIVFGVAYHIQNRSRYTIEVADFNFGPQYADYMTFRERLRDSIINSFTRTSVATEESEGGPIWPPNQKYGSMPRF